MLVRRADAAGRGRQALTLLALAAAALASGAQAQRMEPGAPKQELVFEPLVNGSLMYSDNHDQRAVAPESDFITRLGAGVSMRAESGRVRGSLDYMLTAINYARHSNRNALQNTLAARGTADVLDDRLQLLADANINRSAVSAFGVQTGTGGDANDNVTEVRTLRLSPRLRGVLGPAVRYSAQLGYSVSDSSNNNTGDSTLTTATLHLEPSDRAVLGWAVDASHATSDYKTARTYRTDRLDGAGQWTITDLDLLLTARAGYERTNLTTLDAEGGTTWGVGLVWQPSPRTRLALQRDERVVGNTYSMSFDYRLPRTVFSWSKARSLSTDASPTNSAIVSLIQSDPALLAAVQRFLQNGDPTRAVNLDFLRSVATSQDQQQFSVAWTGLRQSVLVNWRTSTVTRIDPLASLAGDLALTDQVRQRGFVLNLSHRLSVDNSLSLLLQTTNSRGVLASQRSKQRIGDLQYSTRLAKDTTLVVSLRRALMESGLQPSFDENSVTATFGVRF